MQRNQFSEPRISLGEEGGYLCESRVAEGIFDGWAVASMGLPLADHREETIDEADGEAVEVILTSTKNPVGTGYLLTLTRRRWTKKLVDCP